MIVRPAAAPLIPSRSGFPVQSSVGGLQRAIFQGSAPHCDGAEEGGGRGQRALQPQTRRDLHLGLGRLQARVHVEGVEFPGQART